MSMERIGRLIQFQHIVINLLVGLSNKSNCPDIDYLVEPINDTNCTMYYLLNRPDLKLIYSCKHHFEWINYIYFDSKSIERPRLFSYELYWNGVATTYEQIRICVKKNTFDLQDMEDYQFFMVRWLITPVYYLFYLVANQIIISNAKCSELNLIFLSLAHHNLQLSYLCKYMT